MDIPRHLWKWFVLRIVGGAVAVLVMVAAAVLRSRHVAAGVWLQWVGLLLLAAVAALSIWVNMTWRRWRLAQLPPDPGSPAQPGSRRRR